MSDKPIATCVSAALTSGQARWCPPVQLKFWNGARGRTERTVERELARSIPELPIDEVAWEPGYDLARWATARDATVPAIDLIIAACALRHGAVLESADADVDHLASVGEPSNR